LIPNFFPDTFTSGTTSQPEGQKAGKKLSSEESVTINIRHVSKVKTLNVNPSDLILFQKMEKQAIAVKEK
jgi:hypothetical protein